MYRQRGLSSEDIVTHAPCNPFPLQPELLPEGLEGAFGCTDTILSHATHGWSVFLSNVTRARQCRKALGKYTCQTGRAQLPGSRKGTPGVQAETCLPNPSPPSPTPPPPRGPREVTGRCLVCYPGFSSPTGGEAPARSGAGEERRTRGFAPVS